MARGPVLGLALLATVSAGAAVADGKDGGVVLGPSMADVARSSPLTPNNSAMHFPMPIPVRALTFDATISSEAASTTNFEPRRVDAAALAPLVAELVAGLRDGLDRRKIGLEGAA